MEKITFLGKKLVGGTKVSFIIAGNNAYYTKDFFEKVSLLKGMPDEKLTMQHEAHKGYWFEVEIWIDTFDSVIDAIKKVFNNGFYSLQEKFDLDDWDTSMI